MATRFYLPASGTAPATPAYDTNWERQFTGWTRRPLVLSKSNTALATLSEAFGATATQQKLYAQWVSETLDVDQTISGTVSMVVGKCAETTLSGDAHLAFSLRVLKPDNTFRGTLLLYHATSSEFPLVASAATRIHDARAITSLACLAGDRIVLEIGIHGVTPANEVMQMRFGDPSATSDFALTAGLTTDLCSWMELSATLTFGAVTIPQAVAGTFGMTGALGRKTSKAFSGPLAMSGVVNRTTSKSLGGTVGTLSGALAAAVLLVKGLAGTLGALAGSLGIKTLKSFGGVLTSVGALARLVTPSSLGGVFGMGGATNVKIFVSLSGLLSFAGVGEGGESFIALGGEISPTGELTGTLLGNGPPLPWLLLQEQMANAARVITFEKRKK